MSSVYSNALCLVSAVNHTVMANPSTSSFQKITFDTVSSNAGGAFSPSGNVYTAPTAGFYQVTTKLRLDDNAAAASYGQGAGSAMTDGPWFLWSQTSTGNPCNRNGLLNSRIVSLNAGDAMLMYGYGFTRYTFAEMSIQLLATSGGLPSLTYAQLSDGTTWPAAAHAGEQAFCSNARLGSQAAGAGTGGFVMASGGAWWMMGGTAVLV